MVGQRRNRLAVPLTSARLLDVLDRMYDLAAAELDWLRGIGEAVRPLVDCGAGVNVWVIPPRATTENLIRRVGVGHDVEPLLAPALDEILVRRQLVSIGTVKQGMSVEVAYSGALREGQKPESLVKALNRLDGVQSVDLVKLTPAPGQDIIW